MVNKLPKLHTYKESNSPYWVAAFSEGMLNEHEQINLAKWCYDAFGPGLGEFRVDNSSFVHRWINDIRWGELRFSEESDFTWFVLRWA